MSLISLQFLVTLNVYNRPLHLNFWQKTISLHRWKFISKQQDANAAVYLQHTELIITMQLEKMALFSFITSKRYILSSFICSFPQPTPSFFGVCQMIRSIALLLQSHGRTADRSWPVTWGLLRSQTVPFLLPFPEGDDQVMPSLPICCFSQICGKGASAKWSHHQQRFKSF